MEEKKRVARLSDVDIPPSFYERIGTGSDALDVIVGGEDLPGIMPGTMWLATGTPGAGKSTLWMQLLNHMSSVGGWSCLFNSGEESMQRVAHRGRRLGIKMDSFTVSTFERVDDLEAYAIENMVEILVVDSLQALAEGDEEVQVHGLVRRLKANLCEEHGITVVGIGHVTKAGAFAGKNSIEHDVDAHIKISLNKDTGNRVIFLPKNRVGPAGIPYEFTMTGEGLDLRKAEVSAGPERGGRRRTPGSIEFMEQVRALLLRGERLSGYCQERFDELRQFGRSGGFMRSALARVTADLQREGFVVHECVLDKRTYVYIDAPPAAPATETLETNLNDDGGQK